MFQSVSVGLKKYRTVICSIIFLVLYSVSISSAAPLYNATNTTLNPQCAPTDPDCTVQQSYFAGTVAVQATSLTNEAIRFTPTQQGGRNYLYFARGLGTSGLIIGNQTTAANTNLTNVSVIRSAGGTDENISLEPGLGDPSGTRGFIALAPNGGNVGVGTATPDSNYTFSVNGTANISGALTLGTPLAVASGGTGATTVSTARANLGISLASQSDVSSVINIAAWGDSLTEGIGQIAYPKQLGMLAGITVYNGGISGQTSSQIATRMLADTSKRSWPTIIWVGRNDYTNPTLIKSNIASMVASLGHNNYLIIGVTTNTGSETVGTSGYNLITQLNSDLATIYGTHFIDMRAYLISQYDSSVATDVIDYNNDVIPRTLTTDNLHLTSKGYNFVAQRIYQSIDVLTNSTAMPVTLPSVSDVFTSLYARPKVTTYLTTNPGVDTFTYVSGGGLYAMGAVQDIGSSSASYKFRDLWLNRDISIGRNAYVLGSLGVGTSSPASMLTVAGNRSASAWGTSGVNFQTVAATYTDTSTAASATVASNMANSFGVPVFAATNTGVTYTNAATLYVAGPPTAGTNVTLTNRYVIQTNNGTNYFYAGTTNGIPALITEGLAGTVGQILIRPSNSSSGAYIEMRDGAGTPNRWWVGTGATSGSDGKFSIYDFRQSQMRLNIDTAGNVGIGGITSPTATLHLRAGTATASSAPLKFTSGTILTSAEVGTMEYNGSLYFTPGTGSRTTILLSGVGVAGGQTIVGGTASSENLTLSSTSNATKGKIILGSAGANVFDEATNRLGIGLTNPSSSVMVRLSSGGDLINLQNGSDQDFLFNISASGAGDKRAFLYTSTATNLAFGVGGSEKMRIQNNGNVGIGITNPTSSLTVRLSGGGDLINLQNGSDQDFLFNISASGAGDKRAFLYTSAATNLAFGVGGSEKMRIQNNGSVGISNAAPGFLLHVGSASTTTGTTVTRFQNAGGTCDVIPSTSGGITCSSDYTLKKNITTLANTPWVYEVTTTQQTDTILNKVLALQPVQYNWNVESDADTKHAGFIAQDVQQLFPELVTTDPATNLLSLNYTGLLPYTIQALQDINITITTLADTTKTNSLRDSLVAWLGSAGNGIGDLFVSKVHTTEVTTDKLCVGTVCVTQQQLEVLLQNQQIQQVPQAPAVIPVEESAPDAAPLVEGESSPAVEPEPVTESVSVPEAPVETAPVE